MARHDLTVLCDEAYFDIRYEGTSKSFVSLPGMEERSLILYTFSKKYAMTGWRLGAAIGPSELIAFQSAWSGATAVTGSGPSPTWPKQSWQRPES